MATAPDIPTITTASNSYNTITVTWGTASFGDPSTGTVTLYGGTTPSPNDQLLSKTSTGATMFGHNPLPANTLYYYRAVASNGSLSSSSGDVTGAALAEAPTVTVDSTTYSSIVIEYTCSADGGAYPKNLQYSIDGGSTWTTGATVVDGTAHSGSYAITGLTPNTAYTIRTRVSTTIGSTAGSTLTATTDRAIGLYGSVNGGSKRIIKLYGSVNGETKLVKKLYGSVNGQSILLLTD